MTTTATNKPIETIRDGSIKATIWKNFGDNGNFYTVQITRTCVIGRLITGQGWALQNRPMVVGYFVLHFALLLQA